MGVTYINVNRLWRAFEISPDWVNAAFNGYQKTSLA